MIIFLFLSVVWVIVGSSIYLWFIAMLFSMVSGKFLYSGEAKYTPRFIFQITTKECLETVKRGVDSIISSCDRVGFTNYEIWVVTENPCPPAFTDSRVRVMAVPGEFVCSARYKARNLEFAKRRRIAEGYQGWIYFMDEENWISEQTIRAITNFAERGNARLASGPLLFGNGGSRFVWLGDSLRTSQGRLCHLGHACGWWPLYGENLLMHSEVEKVIGWEFNGLTEDIIFTAHAGQKGYRTGWHGGGLHSTSPTSLADFIRQRRRWFRGMLQFVFDKNVKVKYRALELYLLLCGLLGILFFAGTAAGLLYHLTTSAVLWYYLFPALLALSAAYFIGCGGNLKDKLTAVSLCWVFVGLEGVAAWQSLLNPPHGFDIVKKT
jgi:egghead protein (zeste-white 4 protein)